ncbi:protein kinase, partial [bacterium]|nr:protein kinase [candidate division CSSED10-310 bacterium]
MNQPKRCPTCMNVLPLARRRCPYCHREVPVVSDRQSRDIMILQTQLNGRFDIVSEVHRRGSSTVYLAHDLILDRKIALKTLKFNLDTSPAVIDRWNQNLRRCLRVDEPHLARMYTFGSSGSQQYIILEFIADGTVEDLIREETNGIPLWKALRIGRDIALGLHAAHNMGIVHHRLTPSNVAVSREGYCRVMDLGAAQGTIDALAQKPWSVAMDSAMYFSPEQIEFGISEPASDQYRIGALLYRILAHRPAFEDTGETGAVARLEQDPPPIRTFNPDIPEELDEIVMKALARMPEHRHVDCKELAMQLESLDPDYWLPDIEPAFRSSTAEATVALLLAETKRNEENREYYRAVSLCEQALALAPYHSEVTTIMLRVQQLHERELELQSIINKALIAFYANNLSDALNILQTGRQIDKDNAELFRLTHEVMQEQERHRLINTLIDAAKIDLAKQAFSSAMSHVVRILDIDPGNETALKLKQRIEFGMEDRASLGMLVARAESAFSGNRIPEAEEIVAKIRQMDPNNFHVRKLADRIERTKNNQLLKMLWATLDTDMQKEHYREAIAILKRIAEVDPSLKSEIRARLMQLR